MKRQYNEAGYLAHYVFRWHGDLIPGGEKYPTEDYFRKSVPSASQEDITAILSDGDRRPASRRVERALLAAWDAFNAALCMKVLKENGVTIRRCPKCNKILESPQAKVCLWCDYSDYGSDAGERTGRGTPRRGASTAPSSPRTRFGVAMA